MSEAKTRVLDVAETLFQEHGYTSVSMRDIAKALDIKQASIYYHVPDGKEQLYMEVAKRMLIRHREGLTAAIDDHDNIHDRLDAIARWIFSQPPMYLFKMMEGDMTELSESNKAHMEEFAFRSIFLPLIRLFEEAKANGEVRNIESGYLGGVLLTLFEGLAFTFRNGINHDNDPQAISRTIDILLNGIRTQPEMESTP